MYSSNKTGVACEMEPAFLSLPSTPNNGSQIYPQESVPTSSRIANFLISKTNSKVRSQSFLAASSVLCPTTHEGQDQGKLSVAARAVDVNKWIAVD